MNKRSTFKGWFIEQFGKREGAAPTNCGLSDETLDNKIATLSSNLSSAQLERDRRRWWDDAFNRCLYAWNAASKLRGETKEPK